MLIDCDSCTARPRACDGCVVSVLLGVPDVPGRAGQPTLDDDERRAVAVLAGAGLVPPLRLAPAQGRAPDAPPAPAPAPRSRRARSRAAG
ncbi:hypothetical protein [Kineococcus sp. SYSU DK004]|uniref:hypothetical protein n=1 Tax=Kineococcus sp. SYSU DK004 TaxID=3383125 RepID=UPI003D7D4D99